MILRGAAAWAYRLSARLLNSIQRKFLLNITGSYSTAPTAALQVIEGIMPLHTKEQEAAYARTDRLHKTSNYSNFNPPITMRTAQHPPNFTHQFFNSKTESLYRSNSFQYPVSIFTRRAQRWKTNLAAPSVSSYNELRIYGATSSLQHSLLSRASCYTGSLSLGKQHQPTG
ncbi:hypothetical protein AVEN_148232-1 [Araneus ventricosus]|uniref:Uncharacterized protein n=1 Tax=Araneus ventricosus TaxID=182803 RepID=A0A4Y2IED7_ARAVE|nr:hypothetical protein AVEN_148232-1 [Araneus ventricosus]